VVSQILPIKCGFLAYLKSSAFCSQENSRKPHTNSLNRRANASKREGIKSTKQRQALEYNEALSERYAHMPEIKRIKRHRHIPKVVKKAGEIKGEELKAIKRREENERKHTKKQFKKRRNEREKMVLAAEK
jgi:WD repeat and SOF domain-containing protein 1